VWALPSGEARRTLKTPPDLGPELVAISPDGTHLLVGSNQSGDASNRLAMANTLWNVKTGPT
jgi:hypothetical protein